MKPVQIREIVQNFPDLLSLLRGAGTTVVHDIQTGATASSQSLVFVSNRLQLAEAKQCPAQVWVVSKELESLATAPVVVLSPNPQLAMALVAKRHFAQTRAHQILSGAKISPHAVISPSAKLGADCIVGPGAVIGDHVEIGDRCIVGANCVIEPSAKIGSDSHLHPLVFVGHGCEIGQRCEVAPHTTIGKEGYGYAHDQKFNHYRITHYGRVVLEDDVHIGSGVSIDRGTFEDSRIGAGTKIDNHCHFGHNIRIGKNTLVTGGMITAGSTTIGNNCVFGGRTTIKGHLSIADGCHFAGLSGIHKDITKRGEYGGLPLQKVGDEMRTRAALKELPALVKRVRQIMKHLGLSAEEASANPTASREL